MLMTAIGMQRLGLSGNLMSLGALDFGLIVDGAVIITENCLSRLATRQHQLERPLTLDERLQEVSIAAREMIQPSVFGQAIIIMVYIPLLTFTGVEGKMFAPMALTVILALVAAFILSLTFVPAMIALLVTGKVQEKESKAIHQAKRAYEPAFSTANCSFCDWSKDVLGIRMACMAMSFSSSVGINSCPILNSRTSDNRKAIVAPKMTAKGLSRLKRKAGS